MVARSTYAKAMKMSPSSFLRSLGMTEEKSGTTAYTKPANSELHRPRACMLTSHARLASLHLSLVADLFVPVLRLQPPLDD